MIKNVFSKACRYFAASERRRKLKNRDFSIISNTCIGGVISNAVREQFRSPTVNLVIYEYEFIIFCRHLQEYSQCELELPSTEEEKRRCENCEYPVGILRGAKKNLPDITVYFVHYKSFEQAKEAWNKRFARVNYENIFIIMDRGMDAKDDVLDLFHNLPFRNKVFFTHKEDNERWPQTFRFSYYTTEDYVTAYMYTRFRKGLLEYRVLDEFDYVTWLNSGKIRKTDIMQK